MPQIKLTLHKEFILNTDNDFDRAGILDALDSMEVEGTASSIAIHDAIKQSLDVDPVGLIDFDEINSNDFEIEVPDDLTLDIPKEQEGD